MSKKPQKAQNIKNKSPIVDQQNQPFLRTIFKRVRNINKKLTQIEDLKKREDLKPQQVEKINRRPEYEQERSRLQNIADFFRQVYTENAEHYKNNQLQQLDALAQAIAVLRSKTHFKEIDRLNDLDRVLTQPSNQSVRESAKTISQVLRRFATDSKLRKSVSAFVEQDPSEQTQQVKPEEKTETVPVTTTKTQEPREQRQPVQEPTQKQQQPITQTQTPPPQQEEKIQEQPHQQQITTTEQTPIEGQEVQKTGQQGTRRQRGDKPRGEYRQRNRNRNYREGQGQRGQTRGQGQQQGGQRKRYTGERRQRPNYRPKEGNRPQRQNEQSESDSSLERQPALRNFRKQEVQRLQDEGFTVVGKVGKPKPKSREQQQWYQHTHGKKAHHHHKKENY